MRRTHEERFMSKVVVGEHSGCWLWTAKTNQSGYGRFTVNRIPILAHRFAYETYVGPIPDGLVIDHLCRTRACVNPAHMETVTVRENTLRGFGVAGVHARKTHCIHGHEFTPENTMMAFPGKNPAWRKCRECNRLKDQRKRADVRKAREQA